MIYYNLVQHNGFIGKNESFFEIFREFGLFYVILFEKSITKA